MINLLLNYDKIVVPKDKFISCLDNLFIKLNCFYPSNIYDSCRSSNEVLDIISYYLQPTLVQKISPKNYVNEHRMKHVYVNNHKNIRLDRNIIKNLKSKSIRDI